MSTRSKIKNSKPNLSRLHKKVVTYIKALESDNYKLKTDPESAVAHIIAQWKDALGQNKRLSVLAASMIELSGGSITLDKALLESFESKVLSIRWELPEGVTDPSVSDKFIFKYESLTQEEAAAAQTPNVSVQSEEGSEEASIELEEPQLIKG